MLSGELEEKLPRFETINFLKEEGKQFKDLVEPNIKNILGQGMRR